jgi:hypothetical protein
MFPLTLILLFTHFLHTLGAAINSRQSATIAGFPLFTKGSLANLGLSTACESVLYSTVNCDGLVQTFGSSVYRGGLGDLDLTNTVCQAQCSRSLATLHRLAARVCTTTELFPGLLTLSLIDSIWGGWNETCIVDPATKSNCNGIKPTGKTIA